MTRTTKATETRMRAVDERIAARLKIRGWALQRPCDCPAERPADLGHSRLCRRGADIRAAALEPCAAGCPDPAMHAEGGHDV
jgi:hypothetical protein